MKKWILNVGLTTITVLPIVAVASCSSTTTESPSLTTEVAKYENKTFPVKGTSTIKTPSAAIESINKGSNTEKLTALQALVSLNLDTKNFTFEDIKAEAGTNNTVSVSVKVIENANKSNSKTVKFVINGFTTGVESALDKEVQRFQTSASVSEEGKKLSAAAAVKKINEATAETRLAELEKITTVPKPSEGFKIEILTAAAGSSESTVDVTIKITQSSDDKSAQATFKITGFTSAQAAIEAEAAKIVDNTVIAAKNTETAAQAAEKINANTLVEYYAKVALSEGFTYDWQSNKIIGDTVEVTVKVSSTDTSITPINHTFIISGFKTVLEVEAEKFATPKQTKNTTITTRHVITSINETASSQAAKETALKALVDFPELTSGFTLTVGLASQATAETSVDVALTVVQTSDKEEKEVTFTVTGLKAETAQQEIERLATANLVNKEVLPGKKSQTAVQAAAAITNLETLGEYYNLIPLPKGITYLYTSDTVDSDTVKVVASVSSSGTTAVSKEFVISGFKTAALEALEAEADKKLTNRAVVSGKEGETATQAKAAITGDTALNQYYENTSLDSGYGYNYGGKSEVNKQNNTILDVTLRVKNRENTISFLKVVQISGFTAPKPIETEALRFDISSPAKTPTTLTMGVISVINAIGENQANKLTALRAYVNNFPTVGEAYTLSIGFAAPDATTPTSVNIPITISPKPTEATTRNAAAEETPVTVTFTITDLTIGTPEEQLKTISMLLNDRKVLDDKKSQTAAEAQAAITSDRQQNLYYQNTTLPSQFSYNYGGKTEVDKTTKTTLNVTIKISIRNTDHALFKVVKISGFADLTSFEDEAQKFAISAPVTTTGTLTTAVITSINNTANDQTAKLAALKTFATLPGTEGYTIAINTAKIDPTTPTSVMVPMTITKAAEGDSAAPTPVSVFFIITGLTVPPTPTEG